MEMTQIIPEAKRELVNTGCFEVGVCCMCYAYRYDSKNEVVIVSLGDNITGIIPKDEVSIGAYTYPEGHSTPHQISSIIGKNIFAKITNVSDETIVLSRKATMLDTFNTLQVGDVVNACITKVHSYGAFVDLGNGVNSLLPVQQFSRCHYTDLDQHFSKGDTVSVKIIDKDPETMRFCISRKDAYPSYEETPDDYIPGDLITVKICTHVCNEGYFAEVTPAISGIINLPSEIEYVPFGTMASAIIKKITPNGFKLSFISFVS